MGDAFSTLYDSIGTSLGGTFFADAFGCWTVEGPGVRVVYFGGGGVGVVGGVGGVVVGIGIGGGGGGGRSGDMMVVVVVVVVVVVDGSHIIIVTVDHGGMMMNMIISGKGRVGFGPFLEWTQCQSIDTNVIFKTSTITIITIIITIITIKHDSGSSRMTKG